MPPHKEPDRSSLAPSGEAGWFDAYLAALVDETVTALEVALWGKSGNTWEAGQRQRVEAFIRSLVTPREVTPAPSGEAPSDEYLVLRDQRTRHGRDISSPDENVLFDEIDRLNAQVAALLASQETLHREVEELRSMAKVGIGMDMKRKADKLEAADAARLIAEQALRRQTERACKFNCDAESACECPAHVAYRACQGVTSDRLADHASQGRKPEEDEHRANAGEGPAPDSISELQVKLAAADAARRTAEQERDTLQSSLYRLHGMRFSDRSYHALKSRAETAEAELTAVETLRTRLDELVPRWRGVTIGSERWIAAHRQCADELADRLSAAPQADHPAP